MRSCSQVGDGSGILNWNGKILFGECWMVLFLEGCFLRLTIEVSSNSVRVGRRAKFGVINCRQLTCCG